MKYFQERTSDLEKVKTDGLSLEHIEKQSPEICLAAVKQNPEAIRFVKDEFRTDEILYPCCSC